MPPLVKVENLIKRFPVKGGAVWAISGVDFEIQHGETFGLVGESGSGKTTTGRCLLRLIEPDGGRIFFQGEDITALTQKEFRRFRAKMQMVFQYPYRSLDPRMDMESIIREPLELQDSMSADEQRKKVRRILDRVRLPQSVSELFAHQISSGVQQRVGIARAVATDPDFVVLDEPISALDLSVRAEILQLLSELKQELGLSYLYISHDLTTVENFCDRVAVMYLTRIIELGAVDQVFRTPRHPYSWGLLASYLPPDPFVVRPEYVLRGEIPSTISLPKGCFFYSRCPEALPPRCRDEHQVLQEVGPGHSVACWRAVGGEIARPYFSPASAAGVV